METVNQSHLNLKKQNENLEDKLSLEFLIPDQERLRVLQITKKNELLSFVVLLSAFKVTVSKIIDEKDTVIGTPVLKSQEQISSMKNKLVLFECDVESELSSKKLIANMKDTVISKYQSSSLVINSDYNNQPEILFYMKNVHSKEFSFQHGLLIEIEMTEDQLRIRCNYNEYEYSKIYVEKLLKTYSYVLNQMVFDIENSIANIQLVNSDEKDKLLHFNKEYDLEQQLQPVYRQFEEQVKTAPTAIALSISNNVASAKEQQYEDITYDELNKKSNQYARKLMDYGIKENDVVGIMLEDQKEVVIAILATLKVGAAYCPINQDSPISYVKNIVKDSNMKILLTSQTYDDDLGIASVHFDYDALNQYDNDNLDITVSQESLAYIIFTSGTTGKPKGVSVTHRGLSNLFQWRIQAYKITPDDVTLQLLPYYFDGYATNLYSSLLSGGMLVLMSEDTRKDMLCIRNVIVDKKISCMSLIPSMFQAIVDSVELNKLKSLKTIVLAAEKASSQLIKECTDSFPELKIINEYGPTENTIVATAKIGMEDYGTNNIGQPIRNVHLYILNSMNNLMPIGMYGEICLSGAGLAKGYINQPINENVVFTQNPYESGLMYRTGDIGRWMEDGTVELYGRKDRQIKIRGHRVELKGIEQYLESVNQVQRAIVEVVEDQLIAYLVSKDKNINVETIKKGMKDEWPEYMIPSKIVQLTAIPELSNGKVDHTKLKTLKVEKEHNEQNRELTEIESIVKEIWCNILNKDTISLDDRFFDVGGNSINLMRVQSEIGQRFDVAIPIADLFQYTTIEMTAKYLSERMLGRENEENEYKKIELPRELVTGQSYDSQCEKQLDHEICAKLKIIEEQLHFNLNTILCGMFCFLLHKTARLPAVTFYTFKKESDLCYELDVDFSELDNFEKLFQIIESSTNFKLFSDKFKDNFEKILSGGESVVPFITIDCAELVDYMREKNNYILFSVMNEDDVKIALSGKVNDDVYIKVDSLMNMYYDLLIQFIDKFSLALH